MRPIEKTAYHEAGHLVCARKEFYCLSNYPQKATIIESDQYIGCIYGISFFIGRQWEDLCKGLHSGSKSRILKSEAKRQIKQDMVVGLAGLAVELKLGYQIDLMAQMQKEPDISGDVNTAYHLAAAYCNKDESKAKSLLFKMFQESCSFFKRPKVWTAVELVKDRLLTTPLIESEELFSLVDQIDSLIDTRKKQLF